MDRVVVDTDVVSFLFKRDTRAELYRPHLDGKEQIISFQTLAELLRWTLVRSWVKLERKSSRSTYDNLLSIRTMLDFAELGLP